MGDVEMSLLGPRPSGLATRAIIAEQLTDAILSGALAAGTVIRQQQLANHYGVSRMPVREAIREIQAKGLLEDRPNRSSVVMPAPAVAELSLQQALTRIDALEKSLCVARDLLDKIALGEDVISADVKKDVEVQRGLIDRILGQSSNNAGLAA